MMASRRRTAALPLMTAAALAWAAAAPVPAPAADATLWACHGPAGQALGVPPLVASTGGDGVIGQVGAGCAGPGDGGVRATFTRPDPSGGSFARWRLDVPGGVAVSGVRLAESVFGDFGAVTLEDGGAAFGVRCDAAAGERCAPGAGSVAGIDVSSVQVDVVDDAAPRGAVGGVVSPAAGKLSLSVRATDAGLGLARATALLDGNAVARADLGGASCADLSPGDLHADLPVTAACPAAVPDAALSVDTTTVPDSTHRLTVVVTDAAGQATTVLDQDVVVANVPVVTSNTATLAIGNGSPVSGASGGGSESGSGSGGGATGGGAAACAKPELSMFLRQRPLRVSHGTAVLRRNGRYRFGGTLTCVVNGKRKASKAGLLVDIINKVGTRSLVKGGVATGPGGTVSVILAYSSSRTLTFRYRGTDGATARVSIKLLVAKAAR
jgi:hypothetical protein